MHLLASADLDLNRKLCRPACVGKLKEAWEKTENTTQTAKGKTRKLESPCRTAASSETRGARALSREAVVRQRDNLGPRGGVNQHRTLGQRLNCHPSPQH